MNTTLRRCFVLLLTAVMLLSVLPAAASAAGYYAIVDDQEVYNTSYTIYGSSTRLFLADVTVEPHSDYYRYFRFYERKGSVYEYVEDEERFFLQNGEKIYLGLFDSRDDYRDGEDDSSYASVLIELRYSTEEFGFSTRPNTDYALSLDDFDPRGSYGLSPKKSGYVVISRLPRQGTLYLSRTEVSADDRISFSDISSGKLVYSAPQDAKTLEDQFEFYANQDSLRVIPQSVMYIDLTTATGSGLAASAAVTVELTKDGSYVFDLDDFDYTGRTYDVEDFDYVSITTLPKYGYLQYNRSDIRTSTLISLADVEDGKLVYTLDDKTDYSNATEDSLVFVIKTDKQNSVYTGTLNIDLSRFSAAGYTYVVKTDTRGSHTFRLSDFDDPNGKYAASDYTATASRNDGELTLRSLPAYGTLTLDDEKLSSGDDIRLDDIRQGLLKYVPTSVTDSRPDTFEFILSDADGTRIARDVLYIDRTAVKTGVVDYYGQGALVAWMGGEDDYVFTLDDLDSDSLTRPLEEYHDTSKDRDGYIEILSLPDSGSLTVGSGRSAYDVVVGDEIRLDEIDAGELSYTRSKKATEAYTDFTFCVYDYRDRLVSDSSVTLYIDYFESAPTSKGSYTYSVGKAAKTVRVEFTDLTVDSATQSISTGLSASDLTDLTAAAGFTGGTLELVADVKGVSLNSRTITLDASLFTDRTKTDVFSTIRLITTDSGQNTSGAAITNVCKLAIPTDSVESLYVMSKADFTVTMEKYTMTAADKADLPNNNYNVGLARKATFYVGNTKVNVANAVMTLPYGKVPHKTSTVVMMTQQSNGRFAPALSSIYNQSDYTVAACCDSGCVCTPYYCGEDSNTSFSDLGDPSVSWAKDFIYFLAAREVVNGTGSGRYSPNSSVTRAQFIKMLVGSLGLYDEAATCSFTDIKGTSDDWAYAYVASAVKAGIVEDGASFHPGTAIDRETMALYAYRASLKNAANITLPTTHAAKEFVDQASISAANRTAVTAMQRAGIIEGNDLNQFRPSGTTTRAAAAKIICMLMQYKYQ